MPLLMLCTIEYAICFKPLLDLLEAFPVKIFSIDPSYDLSLLRNDHKLSVLILGISEKPVVVNPYLPLLISELYPKPDVRR